MAVIRMQCSFGADTTAPRDRMVMTPHFKITDTDPLTDDPQSLVDDLSTALATWASGPREVKVTAYDAEQAAPSPPLATKSRNVGLFPASLGPRELAICLSFYAGVNRPRFRGRLYVPTALINTSAFGLRPTATQQSGVQGLVPILADLGGLDVDWCVWSRRDGAARSVTNWWIDNEWDIQRSRGLLGTSRSTGSVDE